MKEMENYLLKVGLVTRIPFLKYVFVSFWRPFGKLQHMCKILNVQKHWSQRRNVGN